MALRPMTIERLRVARAASFGVFLDAGTGRSTDDILLHRNQQTSELAVGDEVDVMLYLDPKRRLAASMRLPRVEIGGVTRGSVMNVTRDGAFVDVGAERGIFMPFAEMIGRVEPGARVFVKLYRDRAGRLAVSMKAAAKDARMGSIRARASEADAMRILEHMRSSGESVSDRLAPEEIKARFGISKAEFKRALGHLYKARLVVRDGENFTLSTDEASDHV